MGTHPIFESDFDCQQKMMLARLARSNCKNFLAAAAPMSQQQRQLSSGLSQSRLLTPAHKSCFQIDQRREIVAEVGIVGALVGLYYLLIERTSESTLKAPFYQPYECGFNMLGGVTFMGFTALFWIFLIFELEIIMLLLQPTHDQGMPFFLGMLFVSWSYLWLFPTMNNL